jgi:MFS family permease
MLIMKNESKKLSSFLASQILSLFSEELVRFALPAVFFLKTGNAFGSSVLYCCILAPRIFLGPILAYLSDYFSPHLIFKRVIFGQAIWMGMLPLVIATFSSSSLWLWGISAFMLSILNSIQYGAIQTILPQVWKREHLLRANGLLTSFESIALFFAPLSAGFLLDMSGFTFLCYTAMAINFIAFFLQKGISLDFAGKPDSHFLEKKMLTAGWSFIAKNKNLLFNLLCTAPVNLLFAICLALLLPLVLQGTDNKAHIFGIILSMGTIGQFLGGLACRYLGSHFSTKWIFYGGFMIGGALGLFMMGLFPSFLGLAIGLFFCGFGIALINASNQTIWQIFCPDSIRSRVIAARRSINSCLGPIGFLIAIPLSAFLAPFANRIGAFDSYSLLFMICGTLLLLLGILGSSFKICSTQSKNLEDEKCQPKNDF